MLKSTRILVLGFWVFVPALESSTKYSYILALDNFKSCVFVLGLVLEACVLNSSTGPGYSVPLHFLSTANKF